MQIKISKSEWEKMGSKLVESKEQVTTAKIKSIKVTKRAGFGDDMGDNLDDIGGDGFNNDPLSDDFAPNFGGEEKLGVGIENMLADLTKDVQVDEQELAKLETADPEVKKVQKVNKLKKQKSKIDAISNEIDEQIRKEEGHAKVEEEFKNLKKNVYDKPALL